MVADVPEAPDFPENIDIVETNTSFKVQPNTTNKPEPIESMIDASELSTAGGKQIFASVDQTTAKELNTQKMPINSEKITSNLKKLPIDKFPKMDESIELHEVNTSEKIEFGSSELGADLSNIPKKFLKTKEIASVDGNVEQKQDEYINDIKPPFNKKTDGIDVTKSTSAIPIVPINSGCFFISMAFKFESFNSSFERVQICRNYNVTYNIPFSKYMKENRFEIVFM